jgi:hypothetical protein
VGYFARYVRRAALIALSWLALSACSGDDSAGEPVSAPASTSVPHASPVEAVYDYYEAVAEADTQAVWSAFSFTTRGFSRELGVAPGSERFKAGVEAVGDEARCLSGEGARLLFHKDVASLWEVVAIENPTCAFPIGAVAVRQQDGAWRMEFSGPPIIFEKPSSPEPTGPTPAIEFRVQWHPDALAEVRLWLDGQEIEVTPEFEGGLSLISARAQKPLSPGLHNLVAFARRGEWASTGYVWFRVENSDV